MLLVCAAVLFSFNAASCDGDVTTASEQNTLRNKSHNSNEDYKNTFMNVPEVTMESAEESVPSLNRRALAGAPSPPGGGGRGGSSNAHPDDRAAKSSIMTSEGAGLSHNPKYAESPDRDPEQENKLQNFLDKYKVIVNEFMANRNDTSAAASPAAEPPAGRSSGPVLRAHEPPEGLEHRPASGAQLDMSPARGGLVYSLRHKNRLCHRHVLVPEGPKYDSTGKAYLAAHRPARGRDYLRTAPPRLLLPKCCNCCRKSVLGCE